MSLIPRLVIGGLFATFWFAGAITAQPEPSPCKLDALPSGIQLQLKQKFGFWKIQEPETLSESAQKTWGGVHKPDCPGIAVGLFQDPNTPVYAILLVPAEHPNDGYTFLVFSRKSGLSSYELTVVEKSSGPGASNCFLSAVPISRFFDEKSQKKFQEQASQAILMVYSSDQEYESNIYFWADGRYREEPVDF